MSREHCRVLNYRVEDDPIQPFLPVFTASRQDGGHAVSFVVRTNKLTGANYHTVSLSRSRLVELHQMLTEVLEDWPA